MAKDLYRFRPVSGQSLIAGSARCARCPDHDGVTITGGETDRSSNPSSRQRSAAGKGEFRGRHVWRGSERCRPVRSRLALGTLRFRNFAAAVIGEASTAVRDRQSGAGIIADQTARRHASRTGAQVATPPIRMYAALPIVAPAISPAHGEACTSHVHPVKRRVRKSPRPWPSFTRVPVT